MTIAERDKLIVKLRNEGMKLKDIGRRVNLSGDRCGKIYWMEVNGEPRNYRVVNPIDRSAYLKRAQRARETIKREKEGWPKIITHSPDKYLREKLDSRYFMR